MADATTKSRFLGSLRRFLGTVLGVLGGVLIGIVIGLLLPGLTKNTPQPAASASPSASTTAPAGADPAVLVMPDVRGLPLTQARQVLADVGLGPIAVTLSRTPNVAPADYVVAQQPLSGSQNPTTITLILPDKAVMPDLKGKAEAEARRALQAMGSDVTVGRRYFPGAPAGVVQGSTPKPGEALTGPASLDVAAAPQQGFLADLAVTGPAAAGTADANGVHYDHATLVTVRPGPITAYWLINRRAASLEGALAVEDHSDPLTACDVRLDADGKTVFTGVLKYGTTTPISVPIDGVLRLTLTAQRTDAGMTPATLVFGNAAVTGGVDDIAALPRR